MCNKGTETWQELSRDITTIAENLRRLADEISLYADAERRPGWDINEIVRVVQRNVLWTVPNLHLENLTIHAMKDSHS